MLQILPTLMIHFQFLFFLQGFELLAYLSNEEQRNLKSCSSQQQPLALELTDDYSSSYFGQQTPDDITEILSTQNIFDFYNDKIDSLSTH